MSNLLAWLLLYIFPMLFTLTLGLYVIAQHHGSLSVKDVLQVFLASVLPIFNIIAFFALLLDLLELYGYKPLDYKIWRNK